MSQAPWSLASRLTEMFALTTSALVLATTGVSWWYVSESTEQSLGHLLREEIDEMMTSYDTLGVDVEVLARAAKEFQAGHPEFPIAWRIWRADGGSEWTSLGDKRLFSRADLANSPALHDKVQVFAGDLRGLVEVGKEHTLFGCLIDGSTSLQQLRGYRTIGLILVLATVVIIFVVGHLLVGRVARTLRQVAQSARDAHRSGGAMQVDLNNAPREIHEIVLALEEMLAQVQTEKERNRIFTASLAHELRSPIQNLMGETEVALMAHRDERKTVLRSHLQELRDLADAVDNLVTICSDRNSERGLTETRESFDLAAEAKLRLARESGYAQARGVRLNLESDGDTRVYGDREGLLRALRNLTANAIEWSAPGSDVDVRLRGENGRVQVTVDDAGPGVPDEMRQRIFEPFFRGPQAKDRRIGYGLGLAIVRSAVDSQGGEIEVSRSPKVARFCISLPRNLMLPSAEETPVPN